jgi:hypothetical protein
MAAHLVMPGDYTTTVEVSRDAAGFDPYYDGRTRRVIEEAVPAHIDFNGGNRSTRTTGTFTDSSFSLLAAPCSLQSGDVVKDLSSGVDYSVEEAFHVTDPMLPHVMAGLERISSS